VRHLLQSWGVESQFARVGQDIVCDLKCPYAHEIHPLLTAEHPVCPLAFMVLGVARITDKNLRLREDGLTEDGAKFTIKHRR